MFQQRTRSVRLRVTSLLWLLSNHFGFIYDTHTFENARNETPIASHDQG